MMGYKGLKQSSSKKINHKQGRNVPSNKPFCSLNKLWEDIVDISLHMSEPWGLMGDFNSVLHPNERMGECVSESLSAHTPLVLTFPHCPRQRSPFRYCEMWADTKDFWKILEEQKQQAYTGCSMYQLVRFLKDLKTPLRKLNKDKFSDIHQQQEIHRVKLLQIQNALHRDPQNKELQ
ncbi:hypothetical protein Cgig2_007580 [Carnegiea gigantea]|uniref:Endonuclease/exonuclease/phosphatase domain-containing protein n=1 Tax=Carnegiea gigantea TaxID=171969 RepID=A0A9Q1GIF0_9CARY|nr:hypothetical protein Cgig2_007580 [Carnegiea gigantea]